MDELVAAGPRPVLRAALAGTVGTVLALFVLLRGLLGVLGPTASSGVTLAAAGASVVFLAATFGGAVGAWQAAVAGVPTRRAIVVVGAAGPALVCLVASVVLAVTESVGAGRALLELAAIIAGFGAGAWSFPRVVVAISSLRGQRGQASVEYVGALVLVAAVVAVLAAGLPRIAGPLGDAFDVITGGGDPQAQTQAGAPGGPGAVADPAADADGDGLSDAEESALGTLPGVSDSDGDGVSDGDERARGTDPTRAVEPITEDNLLKPWERVGTSEDDWRELEDAVLDEVNPGGVEEFLTGPAADGLTLDENGELALIPPGAMLYLKDGKLEVAELQENGVGGGLVKGLVKLVGRGGRALGPALGNALGKLSPALRARLARVGIGRTTADAGLSAAERSGILRDAAAGKGYYGLGTATTREADELGRAFVGEGFTVASDGKTLVSANGLRQYRPPTFKPKLNRYQANFERRFPGQRTRRFQGNGHLDIQNAP